MFTSDFQEKEPKPKEGMKALMYDNTGVFRGIYRYHKEINAFKADKMFL